MEEAFETIDSLIDEEVIEIKKTDKGKDSFYVSNSINDASNEINRKSESEPTIIPLRPIPTINTKRFQRGTICLMQLVKWLPQLAVLINCYRLKDQNPINC